MAQALKGVYRPRTPQSTSFYQLVQDHGECLKNAYPDQYEQQFGYYRPIIEKVFFRYLDCGILRCGFARIRCDHCHSEYLLPFSCKTRTFCPSCHFSLRSMQALPKRSAVFSEWVCEEVLEPVTHRHYVFSIPKILRTYFRYNRRLLSGLSRCAYETVKEMMQAIIVDNSVTPGMIVAIQTFGSSDIHWHPHLHCLVTNGCFDKDGTFHPMDILLPSAIIEVFQHKVFRMLLKEGLITEERVKMILSWRHTGFHVHNEGRVVANDMEGRERLARYLIRPPVSLERLTYDRKNQQVFYQGKTQTYTYQPLDFLAYVSLHIPNKGEQIVRYYGWYSNKSRGLRKKDKSASSAISHADEDLTAYQKKCRSAWARLIRKIYEVDPLLCPRCKHPMKIVAFIEEDSTIQKILKHLGLWETRSHSPPPSSIICEEIVYAGESSTSVPA